jgi:hypothetical protein
MTYMVAMAKSARATPSGMTPTRRKAEQASPPTWVKPQLAALVKEAPDDPEWLQPPPGEGRRGILVSTCQFASTDARLAISEFVFGKHKRTLGNMRVCTLRTKPLIRCF